MQRGNRDVVAIDLECRRARVWLGRVILEQLSPIPQVEKIRSSFTPKPVRYKTALPVAGR